jgi:hypothetical protein
MSKKSFWEKFWLNPWYGFMVILAFGSVISFFQIDSYWADKHNFNGLKGWLGIGIALGVAAIGCLVKAWNTSRTGDS